MERNGDAIFEKHVHIQIEKCVNELYSVSLTEDNCNDEVARGIAKTVSSKIHPKWKLSSSELNNFILFFFSRWNILIFLFLYEAPEQAVRPRTKSEVSVIQKSRRWRKKFLRPTHYTDTSRYFACCFNGDYLRLNFVFFI